MAARTHRDEVDDWIRSRYASFGEAVTPGADLGILDYCGLGLPVMPPEAYFYRRHVFLSDALRAYQQLAGPLVRGVEAAIRKEPPAGRRGAGWKGLVPSLRRFDYEVVEWPPVDGDVRPARRSAVSAILGGLGSPGVRDGRDGDYRAAERALVAWCDRRLGRSGDVSAAFGSRDPEVRVAGEVRLHVHRLLLIYRDPIDFFETKAPALYREWRATGPDWLMSVLATWGSAALLSSSIQNWLRTEPHGRRLWALALLDARPPFGPAPGRLDRASGGAAARPAPGAAEEVACAAEERKAATLALQETTRPAVARWVRKAGTAARKGPRTGRRPE